MNETSNTIIIQDELVIKDGKTLMSLPPSFYTSTAYAKICQLCLKQKRMATKNEVVGVLNGERLNVLNLLGLLSYSIEADYDFKMEEMAYEILNGVSFSFCQFKTEIEENWAAEMKFRRML